MNAQPRKTAPDMPPRRGSPRVFTFTISLPTLVSSIIVFCSGLVAVFCLGILLGRGHNLEAHLPELERVLPPSAPLSPPQVVDAQSGAAGAAAGATPEQAAGQGGRSAAPAPQARPQNDPFARNQILTQADLGREDKPPAGARNAPPGRAPEGRAPAGRAPATGNTAEKPNAAAKPTPAAKPAAATRPAAAASPATPAASPAPRAAPDKDTQRYLYVYQAAAYKDQASCDRFTATLKKAGVQARTEKSVAGNGVIWYRVLIDFTGTPEGTDALRETLQKHGVPKALLRSKTPVR